MSWRRKRSLQHHLLPKQFSSSSFAHLQRTDRFVVVQRVDGRAGRALHVGVSRGLLSGEHQCSSARSHEAVPQAQVTAESGVESGVTQSFSPIHNARGDSIPAFVS